VSAGTISAILGGVALAVSLILADHAWYGSLALLLTLVWTGQHARSERQVRNSARQMADWLTACAQYGTKSIQNADDVHDAGDVARLVRRHDQWVEVIRTHAQQFLHDTDADSVTWLHSFEPRDMSGVNGEHKRIRGWTSIRVERLRTLATRLLEGRTTLKRLYRPA
jgi:hypothetical protein